MAVVTIPASVLRQLATLGLSDEHADAVAGMLSSVEEATKDELAKAIDARRANDRERKARQRHGKSRELTGQDGTSEDNPHPQVSSPQTPKLPTPHSDPKGSSSTPLQRDERASIVREFHEVFWPAWPEKVGKEPALRAWPKARQEAELSEIMDGLAAYRRCKPTERSWMNPATFLNGKRWEDRPSEPVSHLRVAHSNGQGPPRRQSAGTRMFNEAVEIERSGYGNGHHN